MTDELLRVLLLVRKQLLYAASLTHDAAVNLVIRDCKFRIQELSEVKEALLFENKKNQSMKHSKEDLDKLAEIATTLSKNGYETIEDLRKILNTHYSYAQIFFNRRYDDLTKTWINDKYELILQLKKRKKLK